jgi:DNA-binding transcriptional LysR family regulator
MLEVRILAYFVAVAEMGSVSRAAERVLVSQPSLSRQLRGLERALGVPLFIRDGGALRLSAAGQQFLPVARDLLRRHESAEAMTRFTNRQGPLPLTVAAPVTTIVDVLAPFVASVELHGIVVLAREEQPETAYRSLGDGTADLALTNEPPSRQYGSHLIIRFPVYAYVDLAHPWASMQSVTLSDLAETSLITCPASGTSRVLRSLQDAGLACNVAYDVSAPQMAQALAAAGHGVAVLSDDPRYGLHPLLIVGPDGPMAVPLYACWETTHYAATHIRFCIEQLTAYCHEHWPLR